LPYADTQWKRQPMRFWNAWMRVMGPRDAMAKVHVAMCQVNACGIEVAG
jgi:hypothetical protein